MNMSYFILSIWVVMIVAMFMLRSHLVHAYSKIDFVVTWYMMIPIIGQIFAVIIWGSLVAIYNEASFRK